MTTVRDHWEPCSPQWLAAMPEGACAWAPRRPGDGQTVSHYHPALPAAAPPVDRAAPADWIDGHPQLEAIAAAVWEKCGRSDSGMCVEDDPRNIAVAALGAVLAVLPPPVPRADVLREAATVADEKARRLPGERGGHDWGQRAADGARAVAVELRRLADEAQPDTEASSAPAVKQCPPGCIACATDESHDPEPSAGAGQDGAGS